jgi:hypothetical protein
VPMVGLPAAALRFRRLSSMTKLAPLAGIHTFRMDRDYECPTAEVRLARSFSTLGAEIRRLDGSTATAMQLDLDCDAIPKASSNVPCQRHKLPPLSHAPKPVPAAVVGSRRSTTSRQQAMDALPFAVATPCWRVPQVLRSA